MDRDGRHGLLGCSVGKSFAVSFGIGVLITSFMSYSPASRQAVATTFRNSKRDVRGAQSRVLPLTADDADSEFEPDHIQTVKALSKAEKNAHFRSTISDFCSKYDNVDGIEMLSRTDRSIVDQFDISKVDIFCKCKPLYKASGPHALNEIKSSDGSFRGLFPFTCTKDCSCGSSSPSPPPPPAPATPPAAKAQDAEAQFLEVDKKCKAANAEKAARLRIDGENAKADASADIYCQCKAKSKASGQGSRTVDFGFWPIQKGFGVFPAKCASCSCHSTFTQIANKQCKDRRAAKAERLVVIDGSITHAEDTNEAAKFYCKCKPWFTARGPGSMKDYFPLHCGPSDCGCHVEPLWSSRKFSWYNVNVGLGAEESNIVYGNVTSDDEISKLFLTAKKKAPFVDIVSLTTQKDLGVLLENEGMLSWFRHFQNVASLTFILPASSIEPVLAALQKEPKKYTAGSAIEGSKNTVPRIHFVEEEFFDAYNHGIGVPYYKVFQQFMKLHAFDLEHVGDHVLIVDSDTSWGMDVQWVYPNGSMSYFYSSLLGPCSGMDPVNFVNSILTTRDYLPLETTGKSCSFEWCGAKHSESDDPWKATEATYAQTHILHHMVFERSIMAALHKTAIKHWGGDSFWEAAMNCWRRENYCRGRVAEYELYYTFSSCYAPEKMISTLSYDVPEGDRYQPKASNESEVHFASFAGSCDVPGMQKCIQKYKNFLLKGCHSHRHGQPVGGC